MTTPTTAPTTDPTDPTESEFDPHEIAADPDARAAAQEAVLRGQQAHDALLQAADLVAALAAATIGDTGTGSGAGNGAGSTPPRPSAQQRAAVQIAKRFGGGAQPPVDGRQPTAKTGQAAAQLARRSFTPRDKS